MAEELDLRFYAITAEIEDVSTGSSDVAVVAPFAGKLVEVHAATNATTTGTAAITTTIDGTTVTNGGPSIAAGAGFLKATAIPTAANWVSEGSVLGATSDGGSTNAAKGGVTFVIKRGG